MAGSVTTVFIGIFGGFVSGLFGVGGGVIFVPLLVLLRQLDPHRAVATSLAVMLPTVAVALCRHSMANMTDWKTAFVLAVFAVLGAWLGASLSLQMHALLLRRLFAALLLVLSLRLFFSK